MNETQKVISFIVPSYNCEKFLDKCLSSFICGEVTERIEVIVVNDGSTDSTLQIAEKYRAKYPETFRIISQENKGHGGALNTGTAAASGRYIKAVDADDRVETKNLPRLVRILEKCSADVVLAHHYTIDEQTGEVRKWRSFPEKFGVCYTFEQIMRDWKSFDRSLTFHGIIYRSDFYKANCIKLSQHVFYEDHEYATVPCCFAKTIMPIDMFLYDYRVGDSSQSVSDLNQLKRIDHTEKVLKRLIREHKRLSGSLDGAADDYYCMKAQGLLLSYIMTVMLVDKNKRRGRAMGDRMMELFRRHMPQTYLLAVKQYKFFRMMNLLHLDKRAWLALSQSRLYNTLRRNHDFN